MKMPRAVGTVPSRRPMIMQLSPTLIIHAINAALDAEGRSDEHIPIDATLSVHVPGGGDWSNTDLELDERDRPLEIRWER